VKLVNEVDISRCYMMTLLCESLLLLLVAHFDAVTFATQPTRFRLVNRKSFPQVALTYFVVGFHHPPSSQQVNMSKTQDLMLLVWVHG